VIRCHGLGESNVAIETVRGAVDSVTLSPPAAFRVGTGPYTASAYWLGALAGQTSGRRLAGAVGTYVDDGAAALGADRGLSHQHLHRCRGVAHR
jgi:hypothetical protein